MRLIFDSAYAARRVVEPHEINDWAFLHLSQNHGIRLQSPEMKLSGKKFLLENDSSSEIYFFKGTYR